MCQTVFEIEQMKIIGVTTERKEIKGKTHKKVFSPKTCAYPGCNNVFTPSTPTQKFCSHECRHYSDQDKTRERVRRYRQRYKLDETVGTGNLGEHRDTNFKVEYNKVSKELRNLCIH